MLTWTYKAVDKKPSGILHDFFTVESDTEPVGVAAGWRLVGVAIADQARALAYFRPAHIEEVCERIGA